jgi:catalase
MGHYKDEDFKDCPVYTTSNGCPVMNPQASQRVGENGPLLLQDFHLIDLLAHFDRERIPERYVLASYLCIFPPKAQPTDIVPTESSTPKEPAPMASSK